MYKKETLYLVLFFFIIQICNAQSLFSNLELSKNSLDYKGSRKNATDRKSLAFSDKGAWFAFGLLEQSEMQGGFSGPYLMTEQNGVWLSSSLISLHLLDNNQQELINWKSSLVNQSSYNSHLEQEFKNEKIDVKQELVFSSGHSAIQKTSITNRTSKTIAINPAFDSKIYLDNMHLSTEGQILKLVSSKSNAVGYIQFLSEKIQIEIGKEGFTANANELVLKPNETKEIVVSQTYIFPQYDWKKEKENLAKIKFDTLLKNTKKEKENQLAQLIAKKKSIYKGAEYSVFLAKLILTLQNNTRIAAEGLKHEGLFPSYHYEWFHGFWAWDSWKHAAAVANFNPELAKNQMRALFDYQEPNGFIPDCIYRDTLIEPNNYRNTKSPLAAWAVWEIYKQNKDISFIKEFYPKLKKYHAWWYKERDHDQDGLCEFGSTDGTLIAGKWESGMDNAVRFDNSKILKNGEHAYSIDQESVDLNSFLYAEKNYLAKMAKVLKLVSEEKNWNEEGTKLKKQIQIQFWDTKTGWFYDTSIDGKNIITDMGCEGFLPLWAEVASVEQAKSIKDNLLNPDTFNTYVPLPTLAANQAKFNPANGYWRGPIWLDQSYFGINGLEKYGYQNEANQLAHKLIHNAEGALEKGKSIRENYHPTTGKGLEAENFSWSAAHYLMLLLKN
ncbi:MGH1-like glycoside hydrolase domain-containing protein [Flavobacterium muglaense]|uniref:Trehalase n=1 Tax=Flavobacterium muglaense TaxID=2764716 RepID=A0A923SG82_9FLAO|nr:trehalase family glycosidase [Flavobacterium muglaense]MBC5837818.1 trehalase [Flavobacterium muglaense]MBC5844424.1 trehalase [Flavobacterium muglaense]